MENARAVLEDLTNMKLQKRTAKVFKIHNVEELLTTCVLKSEKEMREKSEEEFKLSWSVVKDWKETKRYAVDVTEKMRRTCTMR